MTSPQRPARPSRECLTRRGPLRMVAWSLFVLVASACTSDVAEPVATPPTSVVSTWTTPTPTSTTTTVAKTTTAPPTTTTTPATTTTDGQRPLAGSIIVVDPGHNGRNWAHPDEINQRVDIGNGTKPCNTTGTSTNDGYQEASFTWAVAQALVILLRDAGAEVILTRPSNDGWGPCVTERAATGNDNHADAVVSIHADGGPESGRGFHVIHPTNTPGLTDDIYEESLRLARALHHAYAATSMPVADYIGEKGVSERADLGGLNLSDVPAVLLEAGNMRNATDAALLTDPEFQQTIAAAIVAALTEFLSG